MFVVFVKLSIFAIFFESKSGQRSHPQSLRVFFWEIMYFCKNLTKIGVLVKTYSDNFFEITNLVSFFLENTRSLKGSAQDLGESVSFTFHNTANFP